MVIILKVLALFEITLTLLWFLIFWIYSHYEDEYYEYLHSYYCNKFCHRKALEVSGKCYVIANTVYAINALILTLGGIVYLYYIIIIA